MAITENPRPAPPATEVVYRGYHDGPAGAAVVTVENADGEVLRSLPHVVRHSPTGLSWGYLGSGPADTALSLLRDALGDAIRCPSCEGSTQVVYEGSDAHPAPAARAQQPELEEASRCRDCRDGYVVPYQQFKADVVARLGNRWTLSSTEILEWWRAHVA